MTATQAIRSITDTLPSLPDTFAEGQESLMKALLKSTEAVRQILDLLGQDSSGPDSLPSDLLRSLSSLAAECCRTRICSSSSTGYERIVPVFVSDSERSDCVALFDLCTGELKRQSPLYIPDPIEREVPERDRLLFLIRQFTEMRSSRASKEQIKGTGFNRLFGSRG